MKLETINLSRERKLITLLVMNTEFCNTIMHILNTRELKTPYSRFVADWVKEYYEMYGKAPEASIQSIFEAKRPLLNDDEILVSIATFLENLAEDFDPTQYKDMQYHIDDCEEYMRSLHLEAFQDKLHTKVSTGKLDEAEALVAEFKRIGVPQSQGVSMMEDIDVFEKAFNEESLTPLFKLDGDMGKLFTFYRGDLSAVLSASKAGKSWHLLGVTECAVKAGLTVLHVNLEMRETELYQRFWRGINYAPMYDQIVHTPVFKADREPGKEAEIYRVMTSTAERKAVDFKDKDAIRAKMKMKYSGGDVIFVTLPSYSTTVADIETVISNLEYYKGINIDVLVVDYADILGSKETEYRHKMNDIWMNLRKLAQTRNIHVTTVSQTNAEGLNGKEITLSAIAEDKRKIAHVASLVGLWGTEEERLAGKVFMKNLVSRYRLDTHDTVCVLQQLDIGRFHTDSMVVTKLDLT